MITFEIPPSDKFTSTTMSRSAIPAWLAQVASNWRYFSTLFLCTKDARRYQDNKSYKKIESFFSWISSTLPLLLWYPIASHCKGDPFEAMKDANINQLFYTDLQTSIFSPKIFAEWIMKWRGENNEVEQWGFIYFTLLIIASNTNSFIVLVTFSPIITSEKV